MKWVFKENVNCYTEEFWYDLTDGGYIIPEKLLANSEQITKLNEAISIVRSFEYAFDQIMEKLIDE